MSFLEFVASVVGSIAWPTVAVIAIALLKRPIADLLTGGAIKLLKIGPQGVEAEFFDETVKRAERDLPERRVPPGRGSEAALAPQGVDDFLEEMSELARVSPSAAVLESFARLEHVLRSALGQETVRASGRRIHSARELGELATSRGLLTDGERAAFNELVALRNAVAHVRPADLDADAAISYARVAMQVMIAVLLEQGRTAQSH